MPRPQDDGVISLTLANMVTVEEARTNPQNPMDRTFGLCEIDIAEVLETFGPAVDFWNIPGQSHVQMFGCNDRSVAAFVALLARVVRPPGPGGLISQPRQGVDS